MKFMANIAQQGDIRQNGKHWKQALGFQKHSYHPIQNYVNIVGHELERMLY